MEFVFCFWEDIESAVEYILGVAGGVGNVYTDVTRSSDGEYL
jgi:hypothetical protein